MKILIIDNSIVPSSWGSQELQRMARLTSGAQIHVRRAPHEDLPISPRGYDCILVSGSKTSCLEDAPWIDQLHQFVKKTLDEKIPYLGICYGHQTLARVLGGKEVCRKAPTPEFGWTLIERTESSPLLHGLPEQFYSFSSHFEEVSVLPSPLKAFASSRDCAIQGIQLNGSPVFGIQFHPEKDIPSADETFQQRKKQGGPQLLHPTESKKYFDPHVGEIIFKNFFQSTQTGTSS
jgi:GMP synthase (glutamine-hydrolysing)